MGFFDFFNFKRRNDPPVNNSKLKSGFKSELDRVEKSVHAKLKPLGFLKYGRTFNRRLDNGVIQVINFQSGQYPIGDNYVIPGIRENYYGKFFVNLGVCVESLYRLQNSTEEKKYYKEYECQIRERLGTLLNGTDYWWTASENNGDPAREIISGLESIGFKWFAGVETIDKIIENLGRSPYITSPRSMLDRALIVWFENKDAGSNLFREYFTGISSDKIGHKEYVKNLAIDLKIDL
jgi:hypothetical protein